MELQKYMRGGLDVSEAEVDSLWTPYDDAKRALDAERADNAMAREAYWATIADLRSELATLQAQLRQVEGERAKWEDIAGLRFAGDHKFVKEMELLKVENTTLRQLVEALPVAGLPVEHARSDDFVVLQANGEWMVHTYNYWAKFATEDEARAYIALLEYRASLPAQPAQGGA